jgi:hypothetical protein
MSDSVTLTGNSRPWGGQATGDCGPYTDGQWRAVWRTLFDGTGNRGPLLHYGGELEVAENHLGADMSIDIADGAAIIDGEWAQNPAVVNLAVAANASGLTRYDLVMAHWTAAAQTTELEIVDGVPGAGAAPDVATYQNSGVEWAVPLATVEVANGAVSIVNADVTDTREFARFRLDPADLIDGVTLDQNAASEIEVADSGIGVDQIAAVIAGAGLTGGGGAALDVNVDGVTLEINADAVRIAAGAAGNGLTGGGGAALAVNVDAATIVIAGDVVQVGTITHANIADRTRYEFIGANQLYASSGNPPTWDAIGAQPQEAEGWLCAVGNDEWAVGHWVAPVGYITGDATITIVWSHTAAANQVARLHFEYIDEMACDGDLTAGTTDISEDATANLADANKRMCWSLSTVVAMVEGSHLDFTVGREGTNINDTLAVDLVILGVLISYVADM